MNNKILSTAFLVTLCLIAFSCSKPESGIVIDKPEPKENPDPIPQEPEPADTLEQIFLGYVTYWDKTMPDLQYVTHINYSFGMVANSFDKVEIETPSRLKEFVKQRNKFPQLKIMLSVGGWGAGNFSEMAANENYRKKFCESCLAACKQYGLDGIDLDWEYPTSSSAGISSSPNDTKNFTLLLKDMRETLGPDKLLTFASSSSAKYVDFASCIQYLDFVNIMTYDMGNPPQHNAGLYKSTMTRRSTDESVALHYKAGVPYSKIVVGAPFFGRQKFSNGTTESVDYNEIDFTGLTRRWDSIAKVPYLVNLAGEMVISYDDQESIKYKAKYVKDKKVRGIMVWNLEADDSNWTLMKTIHDTMFEN